MGDIRITRLAKKSKNYCQFFTVHNTSLTWALQQSRKWAQNRQDFDETVVETHTLSKSIDFTKRDTNCPEKSYDI